MYPRHQDQEPESMRLPSGPFSAAASSALMRPLIKVNYRVFYYKNNVIEKSEQFLKQKEKHFYPPRDDNPGYFVISMRPFSNGRTTTRVALTFCSVISIGTVADISLRLYILCVPAPNNYIALHPEPVL